jgi:hypothetical protein
LLTEDFFSNLSSRLEYQKILETNDEMSLLSLGLELTKNIMKLFQHQQESHELVYKPVYPFMVKYYGLVGQLGKVKERVGNFNMFNYKSYPCGAMKYFNVV